MIGFSPQLVTGVWTGYDKGRTIDSVEETAYAKKIWASFMESALFSSHLLPSYDRITVHLIFMSRIEEVDCVRIIIVH
ncbi:hypothetical protein BSAF29S_06042 [Bacillus safensis subsp. safensis]